ncbi:sigma-70 family RNA polymerase sigma factor [Paramicrobacterium agarici]|uniref:RNA polymerase sigma factor (Sigma-70 family) n=1 Tax=Paramicrobacterium agarici TaxID=630514 RepID=A0A2A9E0X3_9MICO|nr:sigma-70 family RNA polymerase sigma factor [Microbacterium agarici]PFG32025.1 RNA polymerase sigma factor (sigma-70 family) [Microbacterium agarici]
MFGANAAEPSDSRLIERTRDGDESAYAELWRRHSAAGLTVARSITSSLDHDDLVQEAFVRVFTAVRKGGGPKGAFRPYLFTTLRNTAAEWGRKRRETSLDRLESFEDPATSEAETEAALDRGLTAKAFRSLPSRWQEVLWYSEVEQMTPAEIGPLLGMKTNSVAALTYRAREGLRQAWIQAHINSAVEGSECRWTLERMGSYARSALGKRDTVRFEEHLDECARCTIVVAEAKAVGSRIALVLLPLAIGATGASSYLAWLQSGQDAAVMAMPAGLAASVGAPAGAAGAGAASGGSGGASGGGASGSAGGAGTTSTGLSAGALAVGGTVIAGVLAAAVAAAVIFIPTLSPVDGDAQTSPPQAAGQPPAVGDPDDGAELVLPDEKLPPEDSVPPADDAPPADSPPAAEPPAQDPPVAAPPVDEPPSDDVDDAAPPSKPDDSDDDTVNPPPGETPLAAPSDIAYDNGGGTSYPVVSGTAAPGSTVTLAITSAGEEPTTQSTGESASLMMAPTAASIEPLVVTADGQGAWVTEPLRYNPGAYSLTATTTLGERSSPASAPVEFVVTASPAITGVGGTAHCSLDPATEEIACDEATAVDITSLTFAGTNNAPVQITLTNGDASPFVWTAEISDEGTLAWEFEDPLPVEVALGDTVSIEYVASGSAVPGTSRLLLTYLEDPAVASPGSSAAASIDPPSRAMRSEDLVSGA